MIRFPVDLRRLMPLYAKGCWWSPIYKDRVFDRLRQNKPFEEKELNFVQSFLQKGYSFWDIGANFGLYAVLAAKKIGPSGHVLAVEPDPQNIRRLNRNILINHIKVEIVPCALGECEELAEFCSCSEAAFSSLRVAKVPGTVRKIIVRKITLDGLAEQLGWPAVNLAKIDVEGAQLLVFRGGVRFFEIEPRPIVLAEFSDLRSIAFGYSSSRAYDWLAKRDYLWFAFDDAGKLIEQPPKASYGYDNLVGCPIEKLASLSAWMENPITVPRG